MSDDNEDAHWKWIWSIMMIIVGFIAGVTITGKVSEVRAGAYCECQNEINETLRYLREIKTEISILESTTDRISAKQSSKEKAH